MKYKYSLYNITQQTGNRLAAFFYMARNKLPYVMLLDGEIGTGKTAFSRAYITSEQRDVPFGSPTYSIVRSYDLGDRKVNHFDLYRVQEHDYEWIYELLEDEAAFFLFEWAQLHEELFDGLELIALRFFYETEQTRNVDVTVDEKYEKVIEEFLVYEGIVFKKCYEPFSN